VGGEACARGDRSEWLLVLVKVTVLVLVVVWAAPVSLGGMQMVGVVFGHRVLLIWCFLYVLANAPRCEGVCGLGMGVLTG
jgi:hypothetical protein